MQSSLEPMKNFKLKKEKQPDTKSKERKPDYTRQRQNKRND